MSRVKPILVICFALLYLNLGVDSQSVNFTKKSFIEFYSKDNVNIVKANDSIILVGTYDNFINMTTLDGVVINNCEYSLPFNESILTETKQAVALGNGKILVYTLVFYEKELRKSKLRQNSIVIIDPRNCSSIRTLDMKVDDVRVQSIIPYHDSFDLLFRNATIKRFNDLAESMHLDHHLNVGPDDRRDEYVQTIKPYDASEGYIFRQNIFDNSTQLKRLDSNFQTIKAVIFEPDMQEISTTHNRISTCGQSYNDNLHNWYSICNFFNAKDLSRQASVKMYRSTSEFQVSNANVANLPDGSSLVVLSFELTDGDVKKSHPKEYYLQRVNADGSTQKPVFVDTYYNKMNFPSEVSIFLLDGGEVCLIVMDFWFEDELMKRSVTNKCFMLD